MNLMPVFPVCSKCRTTIPVADFNQDAFATCAGCGAAVRVIAFAALFRPPVRGTTGEAVMTDGESACFYHENKKAAVVCDGCGRFLCALCDCPVHGKHLCPTCLEGGKARPTVPALDGVRPLYGYQALLCAVLPLFITGIAAIWIALRHWKAPGSLVSQNQRWQMPLALALGILQTLGLGLLIYLGVRG